jgi:hypothetical protein
MATVAAVVFNTERREKPIASSPKSLFLSFLDRSIVVGFLPAFKGNTKRWFARPWLRILTQFGRALGNIRRAGTRSFKFART